MALLRFVFHNFHLKVVALLVAAIIWLYAVLERVQTAYLDLPVISGKVPAGMTIASIDTSLVRAQLSGKGRELLLLRFRKPAFRLSLTADNPGRARVKLTQEQTNLPAGIQLVAAKPEFVGVDLDQQARRLAKVNVPTRGKPARGFVLTAVRALDNIYLTGPQEEIGLVAAVNAESLDLGNLSASTDRRLRVLAPAGKSYGVEPESVTVTVRIEPEEVRTFAEVNLSVFKPASHTVTVRPGQAKVTVSGAADAVRSLTLQGISATLKITDTAAKGARRMPVEITLPPGISLVKCEPALFEVEVK